MTLRNTRCHGPAEGTSTSVGPLTVPRLQLCDESDEDTVLPSAVFFFVFFTWFYFSFFLSLCGIPSLFTLQNRGFQASEHVSYLSGTFLKRFSTTCLLQWERLRCEMSHLLPPPSPTPTSSPTLTPCFFFSFPLLYSNNFRSFFSSGFILLWTCATRSLTEPLVYSWVSNKGRPLMCMNYSTATHFIFSFFIFSFFWLAVFHLLSK